MQRFRQDHEGIKPDESVLALWRCDEVAASSGLFDSSYSASYSLVVQGNAGTSVFGVFDGVANHAKRTSVVGWCQSSAAASAHTFLGTTATAGLSYMLWWRETSSPTTRALLEYSSRESPAADADLSPIGIYQLADGNIRLQWDLSTTSLGHFQDFALLPTSASGNVHHVGFSLGMSTACANVREVSVYQQGVQTNSALMMRPLSGAAGGGSNGRWVIGASKRWGTGTGASPVFLGTTIDRDDIAVWKTALPSQKFSEIYGSAVRGWNERRLYDSQNFRPKVRVFIENANDRMVDVTDLYGYNWLQEVDISEEADVPIATAKIKLNRYRGQLLNMSPTHETSLLNIADSGSFNALLDLRRKVRIEVGNIPSEWQPQGWETRTRYEGYIDGLSWGTDSVEITCADKMAPLHDTFQLDPRPFDYYDTETLAETHLQNIIDANKPFISEPVTRTFGYLDGTPLVYTPASTGWVLRYDDTQSTTVDELLRGVSDQIGWDCRFKHYDPWQTSRLTFYSPPRTLALDIQQIRVFPSASSNSYEVTTRIPHGMTEEQSFTITGTTSHNFTKTVADVLDYHKFVTQEEPTSSVPATLPAGCTGYWNSADASNVIAGGTKFSQLTDLSGSGRHMTQATGANQPLVATVDGAQVAQTTGVEFMQAGAATLDDFINNNAATLLVRVRPTTITATSGNTFDNQPIIIDFGGYFGLVFKSLGGGNYEAQAYNFDGTDDKVTATITIDTWLDIAMRHEAGNLYIQLNGVDIGSVASGNTSVLTSVVRLFTTYSGGAAPSFIGYLRAMALWDRALSAAEQTEGLAFFVGGSVSGGGVVMVTSTETVGAVNYAPVYTFSDSQIREFDSITKSIEKIRNCAIVKYKRTGMDTVTYPVTLISNSGGGDVVSLSIPTSATFSSALRKLAVGNEFTITNCADTDGNAVYTVGTIAHGAGTFDITSAEVVTAAVSATSACFKSDYVNYMEAVATNTVSIARYGLRTCAVYEGSSGNIDTGAEAIALARAIVSDLAEPNADFGMKIPCAPWIELHDYIAVSPDKKARFSTTQQMAVTSVQHHFENEKSYTRINLRNNTPSLGDTWPERVIVGVHRPGTPDARMPSEASNAYFHPRWRSNMGHMFNFGVDPWNNSRGGGRRRRRHDKMEVHMSTKTSGFVPSAASTMVASLRGHSIAIHHDAAGDPLTPGTTYYTRWRTQDIYGNFSQFSPATSMVARFHNKPPAAYVYALSSSITFGGGVWSNIPMGSTVYDNYNNWTQNGVTSNGTAAFLTSPPSTNYWRMPCDGVCRVEARIGVRNDGSFKANTQVEYGVFRLESNLPGGNASIPILHYVGPFYEGGVSTKTDPYYGALYVGTTISSLFINLKTDVTANSGDYICLGIKPEGKGLYLCRALSETAASATWARYTVTSQD